MFLSVEFFVVSSKKLGFCGFDLVRDFPNSFFFKLINLDIYHFDVLFANMTSKEVTEYLCSAVFFL